MSEARKLHKMERRELKVVGCGLQTSSKMF